MLHKSLKIFIFFLIQLILFVCVGDSVAIAAKIEPEIKKAVTFIFVPGAQGKPVPNGTGFFVVIKDEKNPDRIFGYLVTAKHVLKDKLGVYFNRVYVRLNKKGGDAQLIGLDLMRQGNSIIFMHPDATVDIAVVPVLPSPDMYDFKAISEDMLPTAESFPELHIGEGSDVFFAGLFVSYYGEHRNNPIVRFGRVAMLPEDRIEWRTDATKQSEYVRLYLIETQSYGGNSGSPVFFSLGSDRQPGSIILGLPVIKLAGIMTGSFNDISPIGIVEIPTAPVPVSRQNIGIAAVTPSYLLHEILFSDELTKIRSGTKMDAPAK